MNDSLVSLNLATEADRDTLYRLRHDVYAAELGQHPVNDLRRLQDRCDESNVYLTARRGGEIVGFVSITPPGESGYSLDKYLARAEMPFARSDGAYEVRLLTVPHGRRDQGLALLLMYAAFRYVQAHGGTDIIGMGRRALKPFYAKVGMEFTGKTVVSGAVNFEVMGASMVRLGRQVPRLSPLLARLRRQARWEFDFPFYPEERCAHGGGFFDAVGDGFETLERYQEIVNADVLDAWFPPAPGVLAALSDHLPWLLRTSPPSGAEGLVRTLARTLARTRKMDPASLVVGPGSSSLIYSAFRHWLGPDSRVLLPDPTYGEYAHVLERVLGCRVDRLALKRADDYQLDLNRLAARLATGKYDLCVLVNPNNPTGSFISRPSLEAVMSRLPARTRVWVDEAYIDYLGPDESLERFAADSAGIVVCKSLSKGFALSGVRAAYLCGPPPLISALRVLSPPWAVSLPAQVAAVAALDDPGYYAQRYAETHARREELAAMLTESLPDVVVCPGPANWILCHLPSDGPDAATVCARCRAEGVYLRDLGTVSARLGAHVLRIAVKDAPDNARIVAALRRALTL